MVVSMGALDEESKKALAALSLTGYSWQEFLAKVCSSDLRNHCHSSMRNSQVSHCQVSHCQVSHFTPARAQREGTWEFLVLRAHGQEYPGVVKGMEWGPLVHCLVRGQ